MIFARRGQNQRAPWLQSLHAYRWRGLGACAAARQGAEHENRTSGEVLQSELQHEDHLCQGRMFTTLSLFAIENKHFSCRNAARMHHSQINLICKY